MIIRYGIIDPADLEITPVGVHTPAYLEKHRRHMEKHGIINPILVIAELGRRPYVRAGVTRALCAARYGFTLRAIVCDSAGRFPQLTEIEPKDVAKKFPSGCIFNGFPQGVPDVAAMPVNLND